MEINTARFGSVEIEADDVIRFPEGLIGLPECRDWVLLADTQNDAVAWMQSVERADIAVAVVSPRRFVPEFRMRVARRELVPLELETVDSAQVLVIATRHGRSFALNLKAPVVLNPERRLGRQVITNGDLPIQYEVGSDSPAVRRSA
ncbi:MAG: flagellar assembly protein FliW [Planctomycetota bacterium]|jgi:flagellar assembly factor FliW